MEETAEEWALAYVKSDSLSLKCAPGASPLHWAEPRPPSNNVSPGRPRELRVTTEQPREVKSEDLSRSEVRAQLFHKFWHHELQAAELMAWAVVKFPETPPSFRIGLLGILQDEVRHMGLYQTYIEALGFSLGDFEIRDWMWQRVSRCETPLAFVSLLGMGLEAANLEHAARFEKRLRAVGDEAGALIQEQIGREEVAHVRFASRWFRTWTGDVNFDTWRGALPPDLSALQFMGRNFQTKQRLLAELPQEFLNQLQAWKKR